MNILACLSTDLKDYFKDVVYKFLFSLITELLICLWLLRSLYEVVTPTPMLDLLNHKLEAY